MFMKIRNNLFWYQELVLCMLMHFMFGIKSMFFYLVSRAFFYLVTRACSFHCFMHAYAFSCLIFIAYFIVYCYAWVKGELLWNLTLIHAYITPWVLSSSKRGRLLAQRPSTLVLMMINSCSYSLLIILCIQFQIFNQDISRWLASTKVFWSFHMVIQEPERQVHI